MLAAHLAKLPIELINSYTKVRCCVRHAIMSALIVTADAAARSHIVLTCAGSSRTARTLVRWLTPRQFFMASRVLFSFLYVQNSSSIPLSGLRTLTYLSGLIANVRRCTERC